jgi:hypothetical protein
MSNLFDDTHAAGARFCLTDVEMGLAMLDRADSTNDKTARRRNVANARAAYDAVNRFLPRLQLPEEAESEVRSRLEELGARLERAARE